MQSLEIVKRKEIPGLTSVEIEKGKHSLGLVKDFTKHPTLKDFISDATNLSISWVHLEKGEVLQLHRHPIRSMVIVCKGSGELLGSCEDKVDEGDIALIPPNTMHGFIGGSPRGFWGLSLQFEQRGLYEIPQEALTRFLR